MHLPTTTVLVVLAEHCAGTAPVPLPEQDQVQRPVVAPLTVDGLPREHKFVVGAVEKGPPPFALSDEPHWPLVEVESELAQQLVVIPLELQVQLQPPLTGGPDRTEGVGMP